MRKLATFSFDDGHPRDAVLAGFLRDAGISATFYLVTKNLPDLSAKWYSGHEIGSHTEHHPHLYRCKPAELSLEIAQSRATLQRWSNQPVAAFSYPYGQATIEAATEVKRAGYQVGRMFCVDPDNVWNVPDPFLWPVTARFGSDEYAACEEQARLGHPVHVAGHGYHFDSTAELRELQMLIDLLRGAGYEFVSNTAFVAECLQFDSAHRPEYVEGKERVPPRSVARAMERRRPEAGLAHGRMRA